MFNQGTTNPLATDLNTLRAIEQLASVVNDVETRLHLVKLALAQSAHQGILPTTTGLFSGTNVPMAGMQTPGVPMGINALAILSSLAQSQTPFGVPVTSGTTGFQTPGVPVGLNALAILSSLAQSQNPYGVPLTTGPAFSPFTGVSAPFGFQQFGAPTLAFRL